MSFPFRHDVLGLILLGGLLLCGVMPTTLCSYDVLTCFATPAVIGPPGLIGVFLGLFFWGSFSIRVSTSATASPGEPFRGNSPHRFSRDLLCQHQVFLL